MEVEDDEYEPTAEEIAAEEEEEPLMMANATAWDNFLEYIALTQQDWASPEEDTDLYRKRRAVEFFNLGMPAPAPPLPSGAHEARVWAAAGNKVANDLYALKPTLKSWVPHVMCFVVPRQILPLGDPSRRSCDACESFGAWLKQTIKFRTCRRRLRGESSTHVRKTDEQQGGSSSSVSSAGKSTWKQHFRKGYIQQAFIRGCIKERIGHGAVNEPFLQRADWRRLKSGKATTKYDRKLDEETGGVQRTVHDIMTEQGLGRCVAALL